MGYLRRVVCRWTHPNSKLRPSITGLGGLVCQECGAGYVDLYDAGRLPVPGAFDLERWWLKRLPEWQADLRERPEPIASAEFRVLKGGVVTKIGRIA